MMNQKTDKLAEIQEPHLQEHLKAKEVEYGSMLAISVVILQNLLSYPTLDAFSATAFELLALAIPLLACFFVAKAHQANDKKWTKLGANIGSFLVGVSLWILISRLSVGAGFLFLLVSLPAYIYWGKFFNTIFDEKLWLLPFFMAIISRIAIWSNSITAKFWNKKKGEL
jgi:hypothetical protein